MTGSIPNAVDVVVQIDGADVLAGRAWFQHDRPTRPMTFTYDPGYVASANAYPLDPGLGLDTGSHHTTGLFGAFGDCAPDRWGRRLIQRGLAEEGAPRTLTEADYLLRISDDLRHGAIRFRSVETGEYLSSGTRVPRLIDLPDLAAAVAGAEANPHESVKLLLDAGTSTLGGARPKATVRDGDTLYVAKFSRDADEWNVIGLEKTALDIAERAGVTVPPRRLATIGEQPVLLTERFDRDRGRRVGYLSAMSMLQRRDNDPDRADYLDIAEHVEEESADPGADLRQLWARTAVSVALHNTDDHLRNHGFLRSRTSRRLGSWRLAAAFDINPNPAAEGRSTAIAGAAPDDEIAALMDNAALFRLTGDQARDLLRRVQAAVGAWRELAAANGVAGSDATLLEDAIALQANSLAAAIR